MALQLVNNGQRYSVTILDYFHQNNYVIYVATITDQCFNQQYKLCFRYKSLKNIHQKLMKQEKIRDLMPQFPRTRSFLFVNKTNRSYRNIQDRARELEYYVFKLLNCKGLTGKGQIKAILNKAKMSSTKRRSKSEWGKGKEQQRGNNHNESERQINSRRNNNSLSLEKERLDWKSQKGSGKKYQVEYL